MSKTNNIIEINGKRYDARSGDLLATAKGHALAAKPTDGVVRPAAAAPVNRGHTMDIRPPRKTAAHASKQAPEGSKTLMRHAVKKPSPSFKRNVKVHTRTDVLAKQPSTPVLPKLSFHAVDPTREARAKHIAQSKLISRFGEVTLPARLAIQPATIPVKPAAPMAPKPAPAGTQRSMDIFERAIAHANSHEQPAHKPARHPKRKHRLAGGSLAVVALLLIGGFAVYQNLANLEVHLASKRAGFSAALPGYRPHGFGVGKFAYSAGNVTINFSNADGRNYAVIEQPSSWDSSTLLDSFVAGAAGNSYQTISAAGRTIYVYGQNNATWVDHGVWYQVDSQDSLTTNDIVDLASSM